MNIVNSDDWRRQGQEKFLLGLTFCFQEFKSGRNSSDHEHCEFCQTKISPNEDDLQKGFTTMDGYHWVCPDCFRDFKSEFSWQLLTPPGGRG